MRRRRSIGRRLCLIVALAWALLPGTREADAAVSLRLSPVLVELSAAPGAVGSQAFTIANEGDSPVDLTVAVEPYKSATGELSAQDWLEVEQSQIHLDAGDEATVNVSLRVPNDLDSGGRYAMVTFTAGPQRAAESGVAMAGRLGAALLIAVDGGGELAPEVVIDRFGPVLEPDGRIGFRLRLRNDGNLHAFPSGHVDVESLDGEPFARLDVPATTPLLPDGTIEVAARGSIPVSAEERYRARAVLTTGDGEPITAEVEFSAEALLAVEEARVCENLDRGPTVAIGLRNLGALGLLPYVSVLARDSAGSAQGPSVVRVAPFLWPGETEDLLVDLPARLTSGAYTLSLRADLAAPDAEGRTALPPVERQIAFEIGGLGGNAAPLCAASA